ncbi:hypothetical protein BDY19DRAFT_532954 [Irpex rosettiformis]|uniref:Uncharacterized protein n=1 Tax=Irpex rosettiformis TaxID=378272 RepID=A0ACB8TR11_9APHY|nr:hypothetical protein BDY19DRAFT_532954 [Irpex rosettiformis]
MSTDFDNVITLSSDDSEHMLVQGQDYTAQLPDEILDYIIWNTGPQYGTVATNTSFPEKRNWLSCASVCRRWHRITLPYSFRYIRVMENDSDDDYSEATTLRFRLFLQENPSTAQLIQEVNFVRVAVDIRVLSSILDILPSLRCLVFEHSLTIAERDPDIDYETVDRVLDKLVYCGGQCWSIGCTPGLCARQVPQLLGLFSEIGEFEDQGRCCFEHDLCSESESTTPRIHSFDTTLDLEYYRILNGLGLFHHLTCLHLELPLFAPIQPRLVNFLCAVGRAQKLRELSLSFNQRFDEQAFALGSQLPTTIANSMRDGLMACSGSLHGFRLSTRTWITLPGLTTGENARRTFHLGFLIGLEIIALLDINPLRHVAFRYTVDCAYHCRPEDIRGLDWARVREICRRSVGLRSLNLDVFTKEAQKDDFRACAQNEMRQLELKDIHMLYGEPGKFFRCDDPTCAWYSGKRLNNYITLRHDIHKDD